jgi:hypothetical protein
VLGPCVLRGWLFWLLLCHLWLLVCMLRLSWSTWTSLVAGSTAARGCIAAEQSSEHLVSTGG